MKKTRRTILFLESLENRVVPSNTQALLHSDHIAAEAASLTAVMEPSQMHEAEASETAKTARVSDDITSSAAEKTHPAQSESPEHSNSDHALRGDKSTKTSDEGASDDTALTKGATVDSSSGESMETRADDVTKTDSGKKATHDSEKSKAEDSQSEAGKSSLPDAISSIADPDPIK